MAHRHREAYVTSTKPLGRRDPETSLYSTWERFDDDSTVCNDVSCSSTPGAGTTGSILIQLDTQVPASNLSLQLNTDDLLTKNSRSFTSMRSAHSLESEESTQAFSGGKHHQSWTGSLEELSYPSLIGQSATHDDNIWNYLLDCNLQDGTEAPNEAWHPALDFITSLHAIQRHEFRDSCLRIDPEAVKRYTRIHQESIRRYTRCLRASGDKPLPPLPSTEVRFEEKDPENPHNWARSTKWFYTALAGATMFNATFASTAPSGAAAKLAPRFELSQLEMVLVATVFVGGCVAGPVFWAPLSEMYGRKVTYLVSTALYTQMQFGCALAVNKGMLLAFRFFAGAFASSALTNAGGVITDMFPPMEQGKPMISELLHHNVRGSLQTSEFLFTLMCVSLLRGSVHWYVCSTLCSCSVHLQYSKIGED